MAAQSAPVMCMPANKPGTSQPPMPPEPKPTTGDPIVFRPMKLEDLDQVVTIDQLSFSLPWPAHSFRYELVENDVSRQWVAEVQSLGGMPAAGGAKVIAMIVVWQILDEAHIATLAVHPDYRGRGIGREILLTALRECAAQGAHSATLEVREHNAVAIAMYQKLGFTVVGRRPRYYQDTNEAAILMTLEMPGLKRITGLIG